MYINYIVAELPLSDSASLRIHDVQWSQNRYQHDFGVLTLKEWNVDPATVTPGSPIKLKISHESSFRYWYGYVHHVVHHKSSHKNYTYMYVIGASFVMKQSSQKVYANMSASDVAIKIAKKYKFSYDVAPHPVVYPQIAQAGDTDWELLVRLAKQCGYTLRADGTTLYFKPMSEEFDLLKSVAPSFFSVPPGNPTPPRLYSIEPLIGESVDYDDGAKAAPAVLGVDVKSAKSFKAVNPKRTSKSGEINLDLFDRFETHKTTPTYKSATAYAKAVDELTRFSYRARAIVIGTPDLRPDMPVYITGVDNQVDGYWIVLSTDHVVNSEGYSTEIIIGKDSLSKSKTLPTNKSRILASPPESRLNKISVKASTSKKIAMSKVKNRLSSNPNSYITALWQGTGASIRGKSSAKAKVASTIRRVNNG